MVEVFKTNVSCMEQAETLTALLHREFSATRISFDLEDCDKVLRIDSEDVSPEKVITLLAMHNYTCEELS